MSCGGPGGDWQGKGLAYEMLLAESRLADVDRQALHDEFAAAHPRRDELK